MSARPHLSSRAIPRTSSALKAWRSYSRYIGTEKCRYHLGELYGHHNKLLRSVTWSVMRRHPNLEFDNMLQHAYVGAALAYGRFSEKGGACLSSYVFSSVGLYLLDQMYIELGGKSSKHMFLLRKYFEGRYDSDLFRKKAIEFRYGLSNTVRKDKLKNQVEICFAPSVSFEDIIEIEESDGASFIDHSLPSESELIAKIEFDLARNALPPRASAVLRIYFEEDHTATETARRLQITEGQVRSDIRTIKTLMSRALCT